MGGIHWLGAAAAGFVTLMMGGLWYSRALFGPAWGRAEGRVDKGEEHQHHGKVFAVAYLASVAGAAALSWILGPAPELGRAVGTGAVAGIGLVASSFAINYGFAGRHPVLWLVDAGYHAFQFAITGAVLGAWHAG